VDACAVAHTTVKVPSFLTGLKVPTLFIAAENDEQALPEKVSECDLI
jgi:hypothetical protein